MVVAMEAMERVVPLICNDHEKECVLLLLFALIHSGAMANTIMGIQ